MSRVKKGKKQVNLCLCLIIFCAVGLIYCGAVHKTSNLDETQKGIAKQIIRFHCIANSDDETDQAVKLIVKNNIVSYLQDRLADVNSKKEAEKVLKKEIPTIQKIAEKTIKREGFDYGCKVSLEQCAFPVKVYGDLTFPSGVYESLQVRLGKSSGKNWWCVMYPSLCFVDGTYSVVPDDSKKQLENVLTEDEYKAVSNDNKFNLDISYRFKIKQWWKSVCRKINSL